MSEQDLVKLEDPIEQATAALYMIQFRGKVTLQDLRKDIADRLGVYIHHSTLKSTCEALKKGQFITLELMQTEKGHARLTAAMRTTVFPRNIETAQMAVPRVFLPRLLATEGAEAIRAWFEKEQVSGQTKGGSGPQYKHVHNFSQDVIALDDIIGSQIPNERLNAIREKFSDKAIEQYYIMKSAAKRKGKKADKGKNNGADEEMVIEVTGLFCRCPITGLYIIPSDVWRGWWKANAMRYGDLKEGTGDHAMFSPVYINPKEVVQTVLPVNSSRGSSTPMAYECITAGEQLRISFAHPTTGLLHPAQIEKLLLLSQLRPKRGWSPSRGIRSGRGLPLNFIDHGPVNGMDPNHCGPPPKAAHPGDLTFLLEKVPPPLLEEHGEYLKKAVVRLAEVALGDGRVKGTAKAAPFPVNGNNS